jgi:hypothetical protein
MELVVIVVTLLAFGCPVQAIVQAYGVDERTVASWRDRAGKQCQRVHQAIVEQGQLDLIQGPRRRDPGESPRYGRLDGVGDDGFNTSLARWCGESYARYESGRSAAPTGASLLSGSLHATRLHRWVGGIF